LAKCPRNFRQLIHFSFTVSDSAFPVTFNHHLIKVASSTIIVYIDPCVVLNKLVLNRTQVCQLLCKNTIAQKMCLKSRLNLVSLEKGKLIGTVVTLYLGQMDEKRQFEKGCTKKFEIYIIEKWVYFTQKIAWLSLEICG